MKLFYALTILTAVATQPVLADDPSENGMLNFENMPAAPRGTPYREACRRTANQTHAPNSPWMYESHMSTSFFTDGDSWGVKPKALDFGAEEEPEE